MRPDNPINEDILPLYTTAWFQLDYSLEEKGGIFYIVAKENSRPEYYQPLEAQPPKNKKGRPYKQPHYPEGWNELPHIHLARINTEKTEDILEFVNRWGLLGLWRVEKYREWPWPLHVDSKKQSIYQGKPLEGKFLKCYINPTFENKKSEFYPHRFQEPLPVFIEAVKEFQDLFTLLEGDVNQKSEAQDLLNKYIRECYPVAWHITEPKEQWISHWQTPSLLHACYLLTWLDLIAVCKYRRCKYYHCQKIFIVKHPGEEYCSFRCKENAKRFRYYHNVEKKKKTITEKK